MMGMDPLDDTGHWAHVAGEELALALEAAGIGVLDVEGGTDGVRVSFPSLTAAESLMTLVSDGDATLGGFYDRASGSCVTINALVEQYGDVEDIPEQAQSEAFRVAWAWDIHPHMRGRVMGWHVSVLIPAPDANQATATLNALRLGGAL